VSVSVEQQSADERLVERILKLFYWPAKMSLVPPAQQEVLFAGEGAERAHASIAADNPFDSAQLVHNIRAQQQSDTPHRRLPTETDLPASSYPNIPSVISIYSDSVRSPATPVTKTYSRKRPAPKLGVNFQDLLGQTKRSKDESGSSSVFKTPRVINSYTSDTDFARSPRTIDIRSPVTPQGTPGAGINPGSGGRANNVRVIGIGRPAPRFPVTPTDPPSNVQVIHVFSPSPQQIPNTHRHL